MSHYHDPDIPHSWILFSFQILSPQCLITPQIFCSAMFAVFMLAKSKLMLFIPQCKKIHFWKGKITLVFEI